MEPVTAVAFFETASVTEDTPDFRRPQSGCEFVEPHISRIETAAGKNPGTQRLRIIRQFYPYPSRTISAESSKSAASPSLLPPPFIIRGSFVQEEKTDKATAAIATRNLKSI